MQVDFFIHTTDGMIRFNNHEIFYIQANGTGSKIVTNRGEYLVRTPIGVIGNLKCRVFGNQECRTFGNNDYTINGNKSAEQVTKVRELS